MGGAKTVEDIFLRQSLLHTLLTQTFPHVCVKVVGGVGVCKDDRKRNNPPNPHNVTNLTNIKLGRPVSRVYNFSCKTERKALPYTTRRG